ncbi:MAG: VCBS repeat-containing protein [Candidatus Azobacteroides sp.]|nr:VCBS repeat-containing protein [Candidatus Azobacteroides sp.]
MRRKGFYLSRDLRVRRSTFYLILLFLTITGLKAQTFQPNPDNVFVNPGGSARWNVLSNDELGLYHWSEVIVTIETTPHYAEAGSVSVEPPMNLIRYTPEDGFRGRDSLRYSVYIPATGETKMAWVYINVANQPDNLYTDMCTTTPLPQEWGIVSTRTNEINLSPYQIPIVGDIDGDGIVEILVSANPGSNPVNGIVRPSSQIAIYKGNDIQQPPQIINTVSPYSWTGFTLYAIAKTTLAEKDSTLIVVAEGDFYVRAYNHNGNLIWTSNEKYHPTNYQEISLIIADLNQDGIPEIIICGSIFDSTTGKRLCEAPVNHDNNISSLNTPTPLVADVFNDGNAYFITGNYIYKPDENLSTLTLIRKITPAIHASDPNKPAGNISLPDGGWCSLVDIDNDGKLDLLVTICDIPSRYTFLYVADPETGEIKASKYIPNAATRSYPFVGDIDGDGHPEIVLIKNTTNGAIAPSAEAVVLAYKYEKGNPVFKQFWSFTHSDRSGCTGITLFDFNQDGISELVYRDETDLRIINGSGIHHQTGLPTQPYNLASFSNISGTGYEYPVIADIDGDGQAEILIVGAHSSISGTSASIGPLWVFKSEYPDTSPWAPARRVWNQHAFNPVNINEDLTVPPYPLSPATEFITKTGKRHQPYNNFFQQATMLNDEGEPLNLAADVTFVFGYPAYTIYRQADGEIEVDIFVGNEGNAPTTEPLYLSVYAEKKDGTYTWLHTQQVNISLQPNEQKEISFTFPFILNPSDEYSDFELRLNEKEGVFFFDECLTANNYTKGKMFSPDERIICEGDTETIELYPRGVYKYFWFLYDEVSEMYNPLTEGTWLPTSNGGECRIGINGETMEIKKNPDPVEKFYLMLCDLDGNPVSMVLDSVCVYLTPDTLIWTGYESADWHNYGNWLDPKEADPAHPVNPTSKVPRKCTNVLIPDGLVHYPDLSSSSTTYYYYPTSECANITFEHGGEVIRTDSLDYDRVYIHQQLLGNRWYMLSAPLGDFYPGDYYVHNPNPHLDDVYIYTGFFGQSNPQNGTYIEGEWTGTFNTPGIKFTPGMGFAVWVDDKLPDYSVHTPFDFHFPKYDTGYMLYSWEGNYLHTHTASREKHHRFIYENDGVWDPGTGNITLPITASAPDTKVIVGNPFMAHWNFASFQAANPIKNHYQVLDGTGQNFSTYFQYGTGGINDPSITITTANPPLDEYIPPMQSIIVESTSAFSSLSTHVTHVEQNPGSKLRAATKVPDIRPLYIDAAINGHTNRTVLLMDEDDSFGKEGNALKVLLKENLSYQTDNEGNIIYDYPYPVSIYTLSGQGTMLDIQTVNPQEDIVIPIGISTLQKGTVRLSFEGVQRFSSFSSLYLIDNKGGIFTECVNLSTQPWYEFEKEEEDVFINDRLYLRLTSSPMSLEQLPEKENDIRFYREGNSLRLVSSTGENIEEVIVSDLQGYVLFRKTDCNNPEVILQPAMPATGFYLVRCNTRTTNKVFKIYY